MSQQPIKIINTEALKDEKITTRCFKYCIREFVTPDL